MKEKSKEILIKLVCDKNNKVRSAAIVSLGQIYIDGLDKDIDVLNHDVEKIFEIGYLIDQMVWMSLL